MPTRSMGAPTMISLSMENACRLFNDWDHAKICKIYIV